MRLIRLSSALAAGIAVAVAASACSSAGTASAPRTISSEQVTLEGSITRVDRANRMVTIRGPEGGEVDIYVGDHVRNFEQLQVGDRVALDYTSAVALELNPAGVTEAGTTLAQGGSRSEPGARPGGTTSETVGLVTEVVAVDATANTVTLKGPRGNVVTLDVLREDLRKGLRKLKPGDLLKVTFTEAAAIAIRPRPGS